MANERVIPILALGQVRTTRLQPSLHGRRVNAPECRPVGRLGAAERSPGVLRVPGCSRPVSAARSPPSSRRTRPKRPNAENPLELGCQRALALPAVVGACAASRCNCSVIATCRLVKPA